MPRGDQQSSTTGLMSIRQGDIMLISIVLDEEIQQKFGLCTSGVRNLLLGETRWRLPGFRLSRGSFQHLILAAPAHREHIDLATCNRYPELFHLLVHEIGSASVWTHFSSLHSFQMTEL